MKKADIISAGLVVLAGLFLLTTVIPTWVVAHEEGGYGLGARVMPYITATLLFGLAVIFFTGRIFGWGNGADEEDTPIDARGCRFYGLSAAYLIAMTVLFELAGFLVAGPLTIAGFMLAMGERRPVAIVATSVLASGAIWLFFWQLLRFPLP